VRPVARSSWCTATNVPENAGRALERDSRLAEENSRDRRTSPLEAGEMDPYGVREVVIEFDNGNADVFRPRMHEEFKSYELQQMAVYIETISRGLNKDPNRLA
jgi:hypothetical protein